MNKANRRTEFQFYWYYDYTCFGQPFCPSSGVLSRTSALQFRPTPGSKRSSNLHKMYQCRCAAKNSWWWAERLPETCRVVIPIKLEFSASVGFIHKVFVTMHGHTILKNTKKGTGSTDFLHARQMWCSKISYCHSSHKVFRKRTPCKQATTAQSMLEDLTLGEFVKEFSNFYETLWYINVFRVPATRPCINLLAPEFGI